MIPDTISPHLIAPETAHDTDASAAKTPEGVIVGTTILDLPEPVLEEVLPDGFSDVLKQQQDGTSQSAPAATSLTSFVIGLSEVMTHTHPYVGIM